MAVAISVGYMSRDIKGILRSFGFSSRGGCWEHRNILLLLPFHTIVLAHTMSSDLSTAGRPPGSEMMIIQPEDGGPMPDYPCEVIV